MAAEAGHVEVVRLLVESGASPRAESLVSEQIIFVSSLIRPCVMASFPQRGGVIRSVKVSIYLTRFCATQLAKRDVSRSYTNVVFCWVKSFRRQSIFVYFIEVLRQQNT